MGRIRIATWNCFGAPQNLGDLVSGTPFWAERLDSPELAAAFAAFDVVCIQENFVRRTQRVLERLRSECGFEALWTDSTGFDANGPSVFGSGLAILSRFPIRAKLDVYDKLGVGFDKFARKAFVSAALVLPDGVVVRIVNTHLQSDDRSVQPELMRAVRQLQLGELRAHLAMLPPDPLIVCGDFNVVGGSEEHADIVADWMNLNLHDIVGGSEPFTSSPAENDMLRCNDAAARPERLDHIFIATPTRWNVRLLETPVRILDRPLSGVPNAPGKCGAGVRAFASDHFGLGAAFEFIRKPVQARRPTVRIGPDGTIFSHTPS